ncbi:MAG TPA: HupE/UreJ family protein [Saprospiraceae bacterium]|nr:HupE/UreJ family protein [Saprospiraceae bacterium]
MQSTFSAYLTLGFDHISDLNGYDHILFIIALCAIYQLREWRKVAILVTAFTIGHSFTLALAALDIIPINGALIEFLIPVTILLTAIYNVVVHKFKGDTEEKTFNRKINWNYLFALVFGLIHGMGFSNFFRSTVMPGEENQFIQQLFAFNVGVELGQLAIVAAVLFASFVAMNLLKVRQREWNVFISGGAAGIALIMALERIPW